MRGNRGWLSRRRWEGTQTCQPPEIPRWSMWGEMGQIYLPCSGVTYSVAPAAQQVVGQGVLWLQLNGFIQMILQRRERHRLCCRNIVHHCSLDYVCASLSTHICHNNIWMMQPLVIGLQMTSYLKDVSILYLVLHRVIFCHYSTHDGIPGETTLHSHPFISGGTLSVTFSGTFSLFIFIKENMLYLTNCCASSVMMAQCHNCEI